jgi:hypothetical protein
MLGCNNRLHLRNRVGICKQIRIIRIQSNPNKQKRIESKQKGRIVKIVLSKHINIKYRM